MLKLETEMFLSKEEIRGLSGLFRRLTHQIGDEVDAAEMVQAEAEEIIFDELEPKESEE